MEGKICQWKENTYKARSFPAPFQKSLETQNKYAFYFKQNL